LQIKLPSKDRTVYMYTLEGRDQVNTSLSSNVPSSRVAFAAVHVVADPLADIDPSSGGAIDWDATLAYRRYLWSLGMGVAEAMDTAQRGMGLSWEYARELIVRTGGEVRGPEDKFAYGISTDHLDDEHPYSREDILDAYLYQYESVQPVAGTPVVMASRALARTAKSSDDYLWVYSRLLDQIDKPVILHWLGEPFDPALRCYWGSSDTVRAMESCLALIESYQEKIDGIKLSLLDKDLEVEMRSRLPEGVKLYTGDDFNYPELILGDDKGYSHALLGIFDPIAPVAVRALAALDAGNRQAFLDTISPTLPLARHIFRPPTMYYKTGVVFLAYLNGHQSHFRMLGGQESMRSVVHLADLFVLADKAGILIDPELAASRMQLFLQICGIG